MHLVPPRQPWRVAPAPVVPAAVLAVSAPAVSAVVLAVIAGRLAGSSRGGEQ